MSSANSFSLEESKICRLGKGERQNFNSSPNDTTIDLSKLKEFADDN